MRFVFLTLVAIGFQFNASAGDIDGTWKGTGKWIQKGSLVPINKEEPCSLIEIKITQHDQDLVIDKYHAKCGFMDSDWDSLAFKVIDGKVFTEGEEVGTYDGTIFKALMPDGSVQYAFNFEVQRNQAAVSGLRSYYGVKNAMGATVIEGTLAR